MFGVQRPYKGGDVRVTTALCKLLRLGKGVVVREVRFEPDRVIVQVALPSRRLLCPECGYSTRARKDKQPVESVWRHLDLGVWRIQVCCRQRRLWCPAHGARTEGAPSAPPGAEFTRDSSAWWRGWRARSTRRRSSGRCGDCLAPSWPVYRIAEERHEDRAGSV